MVRGLLTVVFPINKSPRLTGRQPWLAAVRIMSSLPEVATYEANILIIKNLTQPIVAVLDKSESAVWLGQGYGVELGHSFTGTREGAEKVPADGCQKTNSNERSQELYEDKRDHCSGRRQSQ